YKIKQMLEMSGLTEQTRVPAGKLSAGWRQRLGLGCAIISEPSILFLDEPTSGVSPIARRGFFKIIRELAGNGTTVMLTTHFMDEAERCHHIAFISEGNLIANDTPKNLKKNVIEGCMVTIEMPNIMEKFLEIQKLPYVLECSIHGASLHIVLENEDLIPVLEKHTGFQAQKIVPSLEDVFLALSKREVN
ncbi:MAG: ABC transporter ATP-binding protein, partial [Bacillota bacterium]